MVNYIHELPCELTSLQTTSNSPAPTKYVFTGEELEFCDTQAMTCLLCGRQFKSTDQLKRHCKESALHKVGSHVVELLARELISGVLEKHGGQQLMLGCQREGR